MTKAILSQLVPTGYALFAGMTDRCMVVTDTEIKVAFALDGRVMRQGSTEPHILLVMPRCERVLPYDSELDPGRALDVALYVQAPGPTVPAFEALKALPAYDPWQDPCGEYTITALLGSKPGKRALARIEKIRRAYQTSPDLGRKY